jgi:hypothetical protein
VRYRPRSAPVPAARQLLAALARDWDGPLGALTDHLDPTAREPAPPRPTNPEDMADHGLTTTVATAGMAALAATPGLAAASWVIAVRQMHGMTWGWRPGSARSRPSPPRGW